MRVVEDNLILPSLFLALCDIQQTHFLDDDEPLEKEQSAIYRRIIGQQMYVSTMTRPDIAFTQHNRCNRKEYMYGVPSVWLIVEGELSN